MKILIDARLYGLEHAGLGRYVMNLIHELSKIDRKNKYTLLLRSKYYMEVKLPANWTKVEADIKHYSLKEQIEIPKIIKNFSPDLVHFPHFNVPLFYRGNYIVTIHDMLMHKFLGLSATTLPALFYFVKQAAYRIVFANAVRGALKIIVPSKAVKDELMEAFLIKKEKIKAIYE